MEGIRGISIIKSNSDGSYGGVATSADFDTDFSTSTVYTLTLKFSGSNITGTVSGGGYTKTIQGSNSEYIQGHMGLEVRTGNDGSPNGCLFDNIKVTACN
ncbi:MAG TPA: hypothetical protein VHY08_21150 [Bacillota bacterium]|nr:hypothetical protein [Bacillota bacterium]